MISGLNRRMMKLLVALALIAYIACKYTIFIIVCALTYPSNKPYIYLYFKTFKSEWVLWPCPPSSTFYMKSKISCQTLSVEWISFTFVTLNETSVFSRT